MAIHKIVEEGGERYLGFALAKLRRLAKEAAGRGGYANRRITTDDGFVIDLSVAGQQQHLHIRGSLYRYEFFTSEHIIRENEASDVYFASPGYTIAETPDSAARVVGSLTRLRGTKAKPVYSQVFTPAEDEFRAADPLEGLDVTASGRGYPVSWGAWQFQKAFEYVWWPDNGNKSIVTSTQAMSPGRNNQCNDLSAYKFFRLANYDAFVADYGFDVPPTYVDASGKKAAAPDTESPFVWWRKAAVQKGYFICTDNVGNFYVYPVQDKRDGIIAPYAVPPEGYKKYTPPYPAWVTLPTVGTFVALTNMWTWQFNKDATRCVSCPMHSEISDFYKASFVTSVGARHPAQPGGVPADWIPGREDIPGLVEFGINITIGSSGDPMDFDVEFTLLRNIYAGDGDRFIFDAAYSLPDKPETMGVAEDVLITSELEIFTTNDEGFDASTTTTLNSVPNVPIIERTGPIRAHYVMNAYENDENVEPTKEIMRLNVWQTDSEMFFLPLTGWAAISYVNNGIYVDQMSPYTRAVGGKPYDTFGMGFLHMIELRNMSIAYTLENYRQNVSETRLFAYNEEFRSAEGSIGTPIPEVLPDYELRVPSSFVYTHCYVLDNVLDTVWGSGFNIHPAGHWSCARGRGIEGFDIIKPFKKPAMTHREKFNQAFNQSRGYDFYGNYWSVPNQDFTSTVPTSRWDLGSFRTNGVWITF